MRSRLVEQKIILYSSQFADWLWHEASPDEQALWDKVATMMYNCFEDMLFRRATIAELFAKVQVIETKWDIHSDEYMDEILSFFD